MAKFKWVLGIIVIVALLISSAPLLACLSPAVAQDTETSQLAPLNPGFLDFLQQPSEPFYGYVPPTMDLSHLKETPVQTEQTLQALPATFDWRTQGKVTPVKNQNPCGTCWLFGTLAAVESRVWIVEDVEYDFSEQNVACCTDPAWVYLIGNRCMGGGNSLKAMDVLAKKGTRLESCDPYNIGTINTDTCNDACTTIKRVTDYRRVASDAGQITEVKTAVYDYGPVSMAYCHEPELFDEVTNIYYWPDCTEYTNHLVCIVGWDDTVGWPGGAGNGAWIVKNSWGSSFGDNGYFYLCYGSANMEEVASYRYKDYDANEIVYYWDEAGLVGFRGYGDTSAWMASVFTSGQDGVLTHVDFWATSNNATYELYVYDGSFVSQLAYQTGSCDDFGYYSIPLTTPVSVTNGQQFTVAVKMITPGFDYPIPVEYEIPGFCEPPIQTGFCFTRHLDSDLWDDAGVGGANVCLRAKITTPPADILAYYRGLGEDPNVVETTDLLQAANDWANEVVPPSFTEPISTTQLLALANEWAATD